MKKKLQIFVSSTYSDLMEDRQAAVEAILRSGNIPAGMELFAAGSESQLEIIKRWIDESDVYMLLLGGRYGSIEPKTGLSYTELEYRYAIEQNKPLFGIVIKEEFLKKRVKKSGTAIIEMDNNDKHKAFKELVCSKICRFYGSRDEIKLSILESILDIQSRYDLKGWIKGEDVPDVKKFMDELQEMEEKNRGLEEQIKVYESGQLDKIGEYSYEEIRKALSKIKITLPKKLAQKEADIETTALKMFNAFGEILSIGINNRVDASDLHMFLIRNLISHLRIYDLAEIVKIPNVAWTRFQTSKLGNKFLAVHSMKSN